MNSPATIHLDLSSDSRTIERPPQGKREISHRWLGFAVTSLLAAGLLSFVLVLGRTPYLNQWLGDPQLVRKCLVVHVNLALGVWFISFLIALYQFLPSPRRQRNDKFWFYLAAGGVLTFVATLFTPATPLMSNYIPVLDHPLFLFGLFAFFLAAAGRTMDSSWLPGQSPGVPSSSIFPAGAQMGVRCGIFAFWMGLVALLWGLAVTPRDMSLAGYYELAFWGGGHILQFAHLGGMTAVWIVLLRQVTGQSILSPRLGVFVYGLLLIPLIIAPTLMAQGTTSLGYYRGFTYLMMWGTWPFVFVVFLFSLGSLISTYRRGKLTSAEVLSPSFLGFVASVALIALGFLLGAMIRRSSTLIPAHYHACIGAVTVAYMVGTYLLLDHLGYRPFSRSRWVAWQPCLYGGGQVLFVLGFAYAGLHGLGRKVYGAEQMVRSSQEYLGLVVMGIGGCLAISGGILFIYIAGSRLLKKNK